ncbi:hypothetical protein CLV32_1179 [Pedobacter duraquae]|uniref:Uncharacterized protein n=1 Tax=Pedobacter duraquae TaxID=425511 RepID=A0A4R6IR46_9SPHI|nr:hypothetical protein CLV32_1179 [Pedobacter duraquae]
MSWQKLPDKRLIFINLELAVHSCTNPVGILPRLFAKKEILSVNKPRNIFPQEKDFSLRTDCISFFIKAQSYAKGDKLSF